ncbi:MAG: PVC-type heme-binding CxxCH protein [Planctomycetaceae bacterium]
MHKPSCLRPTPVSACGFALSISLAAASALCAGETTIGNHTFTLPDGYEITQIAGPPLVNRPITGDFDERGRLYIADSSGSNDKVDVQLEQKPHRILRLEDTDGDGVFDKSITFADRMMFPEGTLWYDGSLYVAAPPSIWKLTDTDGDGTADQRGEWFEGKTLTGCANDLHGPYLGPDGWIYWCKGAFAEQTYESPGREPFVTRAAHIFRRRPEGGPIEPVMTGGMDNPVDVVFTPGGERIFSTTFLQRPGNGLRDGLIHAIYGGVYGKVNGAADGHPRTGDLMPPLVHFGPAAPCGLVHLESDRLVDTTQPNLLACLFNMHRVTRHVLTLQGATFRTEDSDFVVSDNIDFHPTDVLEDADGSIVIVDTGGWYKLCCPTSNLWKPDILGAIYRVRRIGVLPIDDPRGLRIDWSIQSTAQLVELLQDPRFSVRKRALATLRDRGNEAVTELSTILAHADTPQLRLQAVWTLTGMDGLAARAAVRPALHDTDETVRQAALHSVSVRRDVNSLDNVIRVLRDGSSHNRRAAAEALGRFGNPQAIEPLLRRVTPDADRVLEHSVIYALIEIGDAEQTRKALASASAAVRRAALIALDQMPGGPLQPADVVPLLQADAVPLRETVWWVAAHHPDWAPHLVDAMRNAFLTDNSHGAAAREMAPRLPDFAADPAIQALMAELAAERSFLSPVRVALVDAMAASPLERLPDVWAEPLAQFLQDADGDLLIATVKAVGRFAGGGLPEVVVNAARRSARDSGQPAEIRVRALAALPADLRGLDDREMLRFLCQSIAVEQPVAVRTTTSDVLTSTPLNSEQMMLVADALPATGPMELQRVIELFSKSSDETVGRRLVANLSRCTALTSLSLDRLKQVLSSYGETILEEANPLYEQILQDNRDKYAQLEAVLALMEQGDIRRGQRVFHSTKLACNACHTMGYLGGRIGPDLTRIGRIRSERDLLEAILFPSASFVRSYEPTTLLLADGRVLNGVIRDESVSEISLQLDAEKSVRVPLEDVEERLPGTVSVMPAGLDKQLTPQNLADLVTFLKAAQ